MRAPGVPAALCSPTTNYSGLGQRSTVYSHNIGHGFLRSHSHCQTHAQLNQFCHGDISTELVPTHEHAYTQTHTFVQIHYSDMCELQR